MQAGQLAAFLAKAQRLAHAFQPRFQAFALGFLQLSGRAGDLGDALACLGKARIGREPVHDLVLDLFAAPDQVFKELAGALIEFGCAFAGLVKGPAIGANARQPDLVSNINALFLDLFAKCIGCFYLRLGHNSVSIRV